VVPQPKKPKKALAHTGENTLPAPGAVNVTIFCLALTCGHAAKEKQVQKTNSKMLMRLMVPPWKARI
jgi:hypothetical protein